MKRTYQLPVDHHKLSEWLGRPILSPLWVDNLENMKIEQAAFIETFRPLFKELPADPYDVKRQQVEYLLATLPNQKQSILSLYKPFYLGETTLEAFQEVIGLLNDEQKVHFERIKPWRWRSVSQFLVDLEKNAISREPVESFSQEVDENDVRSWPRVFTEAPKHHVEFPIFEAFLMTIAKKVQRFTPTSIRKIRFVVHFMSVKATIKTAGDNSPEGAHEDGADFIVSALVINRKNLKGGKSQIIEKLKDSSKEIIYERILQPGEFVFQADTGEEKVYGNDLWHHVTPFYVDDEALKEGWRDIIGFDINVVE